MMGIINAPRVAFLLSGAVIDDDQRGGPFARAVARGIGRNHLGGSCRDCRSFGRHAPWQIVRERRATFAATPAENARRPGSKTALSNLYLAGDWTDTGLPATIEGAIRSGNRAADLALH